VSRNLLAAAEQYPEGFISFVPCCRPTFSSRQICHVDTGAAFNHHSADVQRSIPVDEVHPEQKRLYDIALRVQRRSFQNPTGSDVVELQISRWICL
jgi:hypothetical protein